jgi:Protein of unknown function (DUF1189)
MPPFSGFTALVRAFYDRSLYRAVARHRGMGLLYLAFLTALCTLPLLVKTQVALMAFNTWPARTLVRQLPAIEIRAGRVSVDRPTPVTIWEPYHGTALALIDVSGEITTVEQAGSVLLLTRDHLIYRKSSAETRSFDLARVKHFSIDRIRAKRWIDIGVRVIPLGLYALAVLAVLVTRVVQVLVLAVLGIAIARARRRVLDFEALMRVAALALTPAAVLDALRGIAGWGFPLWWLVMTAAVVATFLFGIDAVPPLEPDAPDAPNAPEAPAAAAMGDPPIDSLHLTS